MPCPRAAVGKSAAISPEVGLNPFGGYVAGRVFKRSLAASLSGDRTKTNTGR